MKKLLQFGAGKIGRSFIAQLFSRAGYEVVFVDIDPCLVKSLNEAGAYHVHVKGPESDSIYTVENISAIEIASTRSVIQHITEADIIAISVGKKSLLSLAGILARGIKQRYTIDPARPVDIILAENVRNAATLLSAQMEKRLKNLPLRSYVGFVETSIGKMLPLMTREQVEEDPLSIYAEPYNELILDANGFRTKIPEIPELKAKVNMKAWVDRKIFIHNLGHAALAYHANFENPELRYTWEAIRSEKIHHFTKATMLQSAAILYDMYPEEFTMVELEDHINELLFRFGNKSLADTIYRVGCDIARKLGREDRLMLPLQQGRKKALDVSLILESWAKGCYFNAKDDQGMPFRPDQNFRKKYQQDPLWVLQEHCKFDPLDDHDLFMQLNGILVNLKSEK